MGTEAAQTNSERGAKRQPVLRLILLGPVLVLAALVGCSLWPDEPKTAPPAGLPVCYHNARYGLTFFLPAVWRGYSVLNLEWYAALESADYQREIGRERGPIIVLRNPKWKADDHYQDIPITVFTRSQWEAVKPQRLFPYPCGLIDELWHNGHYVFAMWNRYREDEAKGAEEAADIIARNCAANEKALFHPQ
jgi:hypothetical protein